MNELEAARARQKVAEISADHAGESVEVARNKLAMNELRHIAVQLRRAEAELEDNLRTSQQAWRGAESRDGNIPG